MKETEKLDNQNQNDIPEPSSSIALVKYFHFVFNK